MSTHTAKTASHASAGAQDKSARRVSLVELVDALLADQLIEHDAAVQFKHDRRHYKGATHPLVLIAEQRWK